MIFIIFFIKNFKNSAPGRCCLAIRENEIAADTMGIDTTKYKVMAFTLGAAFGRHCRRIVLALLLYCTSGILYFHAFFRYSDHGRLGGLGSMTGAITGAVLLTFISAYLAEYPEWRMIIYSITLIVLMLRRPQGLFGNKELSLKMFHLGGGKDGSTAESK